MKLYGISGLGADHRVFSHLSLECEFVPIDWIELKEEESIEQYAERLSKVIKKDEVFGIIGVSFGGLVAIEISKLLNPKYTFLISSAETKKELSCIVRLVGKTGIVKRLPTKLFDPPRAIALFIFGTNKKELLNNILDDTDLEFAKWAVNELVNWKNETELGQVIKISGTKDKLIPATMDDKTVLIQGGEHFMIVDRAEEISFILNEKIKTLDNN